MTGSPSQRAPATLSLYEGRRGIDPLALLFMAAITAALLGTLILYRVLPEAERVASPIAVVNLDMPPPPPPPATPPPEPTPPQPAIAVVAPLPLVPPLVPKPAPIETRPDPVPTTPSPSDEPATAEPTPSPSLPSRTVSAGDLSASMIHAPPPRYPRESRRQREQGVVVLSVLLDTEGRVADISIQRGSGHRRLDQAALDAVKKWRWRPTIRQGNPVQVRGSVEIPFVLSGVSST